MAFENMRLSKTAKMIVEVCAEVKPGENVCIATDTNKVAIAEVLASACHAVGAETVICIMTPRQAHGNEPPPMMAAAMKTANVIIAPTTYSMSHTDARLAAKEAGARMVILREITEDTFVNGAMTADYRQVFKESSVVAELLTKASKIRMTSSAGTDITMSVAGRTAICVGGIIGPPRMSTALPAGEGAISPAEGSTEGILVVDHSSDGVGLLSEPLKLTISKGQIVKAEGGKEAARFGELISTEGGTNIAEFAIGTNPNSRMQGNVMEDKVKRGCVHVATGDNHTLGGSVNSNIHLDMVILYPNVWLDDEAFLVNGEFTGKFAG
ncbi:aminopeptidase [Chloroflexota bacterium]